MTDIKIKALHRSDLLRRREKKADRLHLPDCPSLVPTQIGKQKLVCDCGMPKHPLPVTQEFFRDDDNRIRVRRRRAGTADRDNAYR